MMRKAVVFLTPLLLVIAAQVYALGLGNIILESSLNQPLRARIEIIDLGGVSPDDITVQLASQADFNRFNADRIAFLTNISFDIERTAAGTFVNVTSSQAVREPYLNIILDTRWPSGRILSEHTVLLDLPAFSNSQSLAEPITEPVAPAVEPPQGNAGREPATSQTVTSATPEPVIAPEPQTPAEPEPQTIADTPEPDAVEPVPAAPSPDSIEILESDTLWEIALRVRPNDSVSVQQTMLAIQRQNPEAFPDGNINRLIAGEVLRIPDLSAIQSFTQQQAVSEVTRQNQQANLGAEPLAAPATGPNSSTAGQQGQLRVLTTEDAQPVSPDAGGAISEENAELDARIQALENQLALQEENADRASLQQQELMARLNDLDSQIASALELISLQDQQLAQLQESLAQAAEEATQSGEIAEPAAVTTAAAPAQQPRGLLDSILASLSNSTTMLIAVAVVVVLLMVMLMIRRNRAVTAEGFEEDFTDELDSEGDDPEDMLRGNRFDDLDDLDDSPENRGLELPAGVAAAAMDADTARDTNDDPHTRIDLGVPLADNDDEDAQALAEADAASEGHQDDNSDVIDFDLDSPARATPESAESGEEAADASEVEEANTDEVMDFDLGEFSGEDDQSATDSEGVDDTIPPEAAHSDGETEESGETEEADPGVTALAGTQAQDEAGEKSQSDHDANEEYDDREYGNLDFDLSDAVDENKDASASIAASGESAAEDEADDSEAFDFDLTEEIDSTEEEPEGIDYKAETASADDADTGIDPVAEDSDAKSDEAPDTIEFEAETASAAEPSDEEVDIDLAVDESESVDDEDSGSIDFEIDPVAADSDVDAEDDSEDLDAIAEDETQTIALDVSDAEEAAEVDIDTDEALDGLEMASLEGAVELDADAGSQDIEIELPDDGELVAEDEIEIDDVLDDELSEHDMHSTGIDFDLTAANEAVEDAANEDAEEVEDIEFSDDEDSDEVADVVEEDETAAGPDAAIELENLDFLSSDKDSAVEGADDDIDFLSDDDEAATKLDLAYAYKKMGDMDGAREILEEVMKEGNDAQVTEARSLMEALVK